MDDRKQEHQRDGGKVDDSQSKPVAEAVYNPGELGRFVHADTCKDGQQQDRDDSGVNNPVPCVNLALGILADLQGSQVITADKAMSPAAGGQNIKAVPEQIQGEDAHCGKMPVPPSGQPSP